MEAKQPTVPAIPIEEALTGAVYKIGGEHVDDLVLENGDPPEHADFVFPNYNVICELKRLEKDQRDDAELVAELQRLYQSWISARKRVPIIIGRGKLSLADLPSDCANEVISLYREPIAVRLRKANRQIKSTKKILNMENALGLLILAQDGDYSMGPSDVFNLVGRCVKGGQFSGIDDVVVLNGNRPAIRKGDSIGYMFFGRASRDSAGRRVSDELIEALRNAWGEELERFWGPMSQAGPFDLNDLSFPRRSKTIG